MTISYISAYREGLNRLYPDLADNLHILPTLEQSVASLAVQFLLALACQASNSANIQLGLNGLASIPRNWLLSNIEREAQFLLDMDDEWEYRRLAEFYFELDVNLSKKLAQLGRESKNEEVVDAATDLWDWITEAGEKYERNCNADN